MKILCPNPNHIDRAFMDALANKLNLGTAKRSKLKLKKSLDRYKFELCNRSFTRNTPATIIRIRE